MKATIPYISIGQRKWNVDNDYVSIGAVCIISGLGGALQGHAMGNKMVKSIGNDALKLSLRFGAGMIGASAAGAKGAVLANAKASAMFAGGLFNSGVALMAGELTDGYTLAQAFVGGALVGYAGTSYFAKTKVAKKAGLTSKYLFGKGSQLGIDGAWTAAASDFAFSDRADYAKKSFGDHLLTGFAGFTGGLLSGMALTSNLGGIDSEMGRKLAGGSMLFGAYAVEYSLLAIGKGDYEKFYRKGWEKKGTIAAHKVLYYSLITNW